MKTFNSLEDIKENIFFIFKHSTSCPISSSAHKSVSAALDRLDIPVYLLVVQDNRELSASIARHFSVVHETPQMLLIKDDEAVWDESHYGIATDTIISVSERHSD